MTGTSLGGEGTSLGGEGPSLGGEAAIKEYRTCTQHEK